MDEMNKIDRPFLILHRAGWSVACTALVGNGGISWLVFGTKGDQSIQAEGRSQEAAWKQACRRAEELGQVQPV